MDHAVSSLILSQFLFFFLPGSSQARSSRLSGNLPCDIWLPVLRQKVKQGGPGAHFMEMQKNSSAHDLQPQQQHFFSQPSADVTGFSCCTRQAAAHAHLAQACTPERAPPRRSKQQNSKAPANRKIFPWMKESRHSDEKSSSRIAGSPTLSSLGYVQLGGDYQPASPPLRSQQPQTRAAFTAECSKYPSFAHDQQLNAQYDTHGSSHAPDPNLELYFPQFATQDRIMQAPKLTHL
ncbi:hypothetical protein fugu_000350 [Takifugu bimaculatus]|uniref:Homeobox domain-containing protein n=1 Tax=Takifugu bimaculatus TaxID=433685 RepID=A0A4Z2CGP4_9TELE|nr:hypothetical protein fugu_000350 [Takifugu bimaculatus]